MFRRPFVPAGQVKRSTIACDGVLLCRACLLRIGIEGDTVRWIERGLGPRNGPRP